MASATGTLRERSESSESIEISPLELTFSCKIPENTCAGAALNWLRLRVSYGSDREIPSSDKARVDQGIEGMHELYNDASALAYRDQTADKAIIQGIKFAAGLNATFIQSGAIGGYADAVAQCPAGFHFFSLKGSSGHAIAVAVHDTTMRFFDSGNEYRTKDRDGVGKLIADWVATDGRNYNEYHMFKITPVMTKKSGNCCILL